jgi:hypothetical protein
MELDGIWNEASWKQTDNEDRHAHLHGRCDVQLGSRRHQPRLTRNPAFRVASRWGTRGARLPDAGCVTS